ncbi:NADH-quinone oxidoreductase subunit J [bacterium NHP-B]|jgi:NADH-quinone oxidoreductase subunit J|nr:NADH-quinone oxidoreductase subunit J [bacterium NHP-B]
MRTHEESPVMTQGILFFFLAAAFLFSFAAIFARLTLHNVLSLIVLFFSVGGLFIFAQAPFLGMVLMIVYVGAVTVFFLFAVMMFGSRLESVHKRSWGQVMGSLILGMVLCASLALCIIVTYHMDSALAPITSPQIADPLPLIGQALYTLYIIPFQLVGLLLFVAIVGGISLTLKHRSETKRQQPFKQIIQKERTTVSYLFVEANKGLKEGDQ